MSTPAISVKGLVKWFGEVKAVDGIDLEVRPGKVYGLLGPNGAGKTTTVRVLTTILQPDAGTAEVLGIDVARHPQAVRERIGLAGQYAAVDENLTGRENLRLIGKLTHLPPVVVRDRADELLDRFGLMHAADRPAMTYSGGMRRRLDLAAALVHKPPVLFLDEPTTGLDPASRKDLWTVIEELVADGTTVLLTTQYLEEADRLAERIAVIDKGKVIAEGTPAELKARLGATMIDLGFASAADAEAAAATLARSEHLPETVGDPRLDGSMVEIAVEEGARTVIHVLRALDADGIAPATLAVREPSLDDVFLSLTGHKAEVTPADTPEDGDAYDDEGVVAAPALGGSPGRHRRRRRGGTP
ncbi:MAG: ATP-binding cassette domain-containing protein [Acidimicrobiales bacterium]